MLLSFNQYMDVVRQQVRSDSGLQLAGMKVINKTLEEEGPQERSTLRSDSAQTIRWDLPLLSALLFVCLFVCFL